MKKFRVSFTYKPGSDPDLPASIDTYALNAFDASTGVLGVQDAQAMGRFIASVAVAEIPDD